MHQQAQHVLGYLRQKKLLKPGDRVGVAVSGGADSVALLRLLLELRGELGIVLSVVHFNHKLRGAEADADEQFVAELAKRHNLDLHSAASDVARHAAEKRLSLEAAGRELRYAHFGRLLQQGRLDRMATAHTLDDQAETVLLRLVRGAGTRGLAGIYPQSTQPTPGSIVRPLLTTRRKEIEAYLAELGQGWREDKSNRDLRHARNRVRHGILPRLERNLNPAVRQVLAETAEIARAEEDYWQAEVARALPEVWDAEDGLKAAALAALPLALQRRVVRAVGESLGVRLEFRHVEEILQLAEEGPGAAAVLSGEWKVTRQRSGLQFAHGRQTDTWQDYEYPLLVPGCTEVPEAAVRVEVLLVTGGQKQNPEELLDAGLLGKELKVRNWRAGDRFWPPHTKAPKKIKELLQERHVSGAARKIWPVVVSGNEVVWMRGFPGSTRFRAGANTREAVMIREIAAHAP